MDVPGRTSTSHVAHGEIPQYLGWTILLLIPKSTTNTRGIDLLDTLWKVVEALIDTRIRASLQMHDVLHGFRSRRGTDMAIVELKLTQEIVNIYQDPLFLVLLELRKAYDTVDRYRLLITLDGYGLGPRICGLLDTFWDCQKVVLIQNGFHVPALPSTRSTRQVGLVSSTLFKVVMDNFIRTWMDMTL